MSETRLEARTKRMTGLSLNINKMFYRKQLNFSGLFQVTACFIINFQWNELDAHQVIGALDGI